MTAVQWFGEQALNYLNDEQKNNLIEVFKQALEIEKQEIEKMYSEEEVLDLLAKFRRENRHKDFIPFKDIQEWFEQFKKK